MEQEQLNAGSTSHWCCSCLLTSCVAVAWSPAVKFMTVSDERGSHIERLEYIEHYPPDTTAALFW